ncbi:MAG TPA: acVLRF1 family peptidyl-tRNA hydrolase [Streptosporangiales bacterium]
MTRVVEVPRRRLPRWLTGFAERHGGPEVDPSGETVVLTGADDGVIATVAVPFPPLDVAAGRPYGGLLDHVAVDRRVGALLVRRGGYAAGVFVGERLVDSKVGSRHVQGRTKAGGWSQQRFARRRDKQAREAFDAAADAAVRVLVPVAAGLATVACGGDRRAVDAVLADDRMAPVRPLAQRRLYSVPDPRLKVLEQFPESFLAVRIEIGEDG